MRVILQIIQVILAVFLIALILIQAKGIGLSSTFGGGFSYYQSKRGVEKTLFIATIVLAVLFSVVSFFNAIIL